MADEETLEKTDEGRGTGKRTIVVVAGLLVAEAVALTVAFMLFASEPEVARAGISEMSAEEIEQERIVEVEVLDDRLPNAKRGVTYLYDTRIFAQVRQRNAERMNRELEQFSNEIKAEVAGMWRGSAKTRLETLTRKLESMFRERLGSDPQTGEPIVEKMVIVLGPGFRIDS